MEEQLRQKLDNFFSQFRPHMYQKGEILIRIGEEPSGIFYLTKGQVKKYAISEKGEEVTINIFRSISFFPMSWAINNSQNSYYYEAVTDVEVRKASRDEVITFIKREPEVLYDLISRVYRGTDGLEKRLVSLMAGNAYVRLLTELIIYVKRFGSKDVKATGDEYTLSVSEIDLAAQTGLTRETVSRAMSTLKKNGLVIYSKNQLIIPSLKNLESEFSEVH